MNREEQLALLKNGVDKWNAWRETSPDTPIDLSAHDLSNLKCPDGTSMALA